MNLLEGECPDLVCTRRRLLTAAGAVAGLTALDVATPRMAFAADKQRGDLLVVITLQGGADGLSLVPPIADPNYTKARPDIGVSASQALKLDRTFGLHPALKPLMPFWNSKQLAIVHAIGDADGTRSHFEATDAMDRGVNATSSTATGWIDRYLVSRGLRSSDFPALAIAGRPEGALAGGIPELDTYDVRGFKIQVAQARQQATELALAQMYADIAGPVAGAARGTLSALKSFGPFRDQPYTPRAGATYPSNGLGYSLKQVAQVARAGVGLEVACVTLGGWDTHVGMGSVAGGPMSDLVGHLGQAMAAFATDLGPLMANTTIVTMTEFGRRVTQNGSGGVDHGYGSSMMVLGGGVRGGKVYGRWPGLAPAQLANGDLKVTTDYRDVLGELVQRRLGGRSLGSVFPDHRFQPLGLARQR